MKTVTQFAAVATLLVTVGAHADSSTSPTDLVLSGPVEAVDISGGAITVLGHRVFTSDAVRVVAGQLVNVYGSIRDDGSIDRAVVESSAVYVPGADIVFVKGAVSASNAALGTLQVGGISVDYTAMLGTTDYRPPVQGEVVGISGIQPVAGGVVLARPALSGGGGVRSELSGGGGVRGALSGGGGVRSELSGGGGIHGA